MMVAFVKKKTSQLKWKGPKKGKKSVFWKNQKIFDCEPTVQLES
jgi:hypothetical protein